MNAETLLHTGDLSACREQLFSEIKHDPSNLKLRIFLFQLSCINRDWKRALTQLDVLRDLSDSTLAMVNTYKQLIECELMRERVLSGAREPICFGEPSDWLAFYIKAYQQYTLGNLEQAKQLIEQGAEKAPTSSGAIDDTSFEWISDGDVRFGPSIEVIINGGYYWLPFAYISKLEFEPVEDLRDLVWRPAHLTLQNKGQLLIFVPVRYPSSDNEEPAHLLAKTCDWDEPVAQFFTGRGQRVFITDNSEAPLLSVSVITLNQHDA